MSLPTATGSPRLRGDVGCQTPPRRNLYKQSLLHSRRCRDAVVLLVLLGVVASCFIVVDSISTESSGCMNLKSITSTLIVPQSGRIFLTRRKAFLSIVTASLLIDGQSTKNAWADAVDDTDATKTNIIDFENRDRKGNFDAVIRDDYWYITGKLPPRLLTTQLKGDDPQWNAFGSCTTSESTGTNSCTYVSINQRRAAYTKYASSISYGANEYQKLGTILQSIGNSEAASALIQQMWDDAADLVSPNESIPPATVDAELKMVLFATAMLTSPNFPGPSRELLVARFYANEVRYANRALYGTIQERNLQQAKQAYEFGRDSWNSYFQTVSRSIVPKVGDPLVPIR